MKPIGILTFHRASNYGAVLQAYALQNVIDGFGREAVIVDYRCRTVEEGHRPWGMFKRHKFPVVLFRCCVAMKKDSIFGAFRRDRLKLSGPVQPEDLEKIQDDYVLLAGSDQVWNNKLSGMDQAYMLTFAREQQRYSYACSLGFDEFPEGTKELYREWLSGMQCISLRENRSVDLIETIGYDARADLDPTLLLSRARWESFMTPAQRPEPYIFVYTVDGDINLLNAARELSSRTGVKILYLNNEYRKNRDIPRVRYSTPEEFVGLFAGAESAIRDLREQLGFESAEAAEKQQKEWTARLTALQAEITRHATAFSIIFGKKFKVELETVKKFNVRSRDLLNSCALQQCILRNGEEDYDFNVDWAEAEKRLGILRRRSMDYIKLIAERADQIEKE